MNDQSVWPRVEQALEDCRKAVPTSAAGASARVTYLAAFAIVQALANATDDLQRTIRDEAQATREELRSPR